MPSSPSFRDWLAAQALRFERPERATYGAEAGKRVLLAFGLLALVLHPLLVATTRALHLGTVWARPAIVATLVAFVLALRRVAARATCGCRPCCTACGR